jgi:hypothetical protein
MSSNGLIDVLVSAFTDKNEEVAEEKVEKVERKKNKKNNCKRCKQREHKEHKIKDYSHSALSIYGENATHISHIEEKTFSFFISPRNKNTIITAHDIYETFKSIVNWDKSSIIEHEMNNLWEVKVKDTKLKLKEVENEVSDINKSKCNVDLLIKFNLD